MDTLCVYFLYKSVEMKMTQWHSKYLSILCWRAPKKLKISRQALLNPTCRIKQEECFVWAGTDCTTLWIFSDMFRFKEWGLRRELGNGKETHGRFEWRFLWLKISINFSLTFLICEIVSSNLWICCVGMIGAWWRRIKSSEMVIVELWWL